MSEINSRHFVFESYLSPDFSHNIIKYYIYYERLTTYGKFYRGYIELHHGRYETFMIRNIVEGKYSKRLSGTTRDDIINTIKNEADELGAYLVEYGINHGPGHRTDIHGTKVVTNYIDYSTLNNQDANNVNNSGNGSLTVSSSSVTNHSSGTIDIDTLEAPNSDIGNAIGNLILKDIESILSDNINDANQINQRLLSIIAKYGTKDKMSNSTPGQDY